MKKPIHWKNIAVEMTSIIFAVLLALGLENWMQDRELREQADQMLIRITAEVQANQVDLKDATQENQGSIDGLVAALAKEDLVFADIAPFISVSSGGGDNAAWSSAKMTNAISVMPIDTMKNLASIQDIQQYYVEHAQALMLKYADISINIQKPEQTEDLTRKFIRHLQVLNSLGTQLNERYDTFLNESSIPKK